MEFRAVFFDAAGTLIRPARPVGEIYAAAARRYGVEAPAREIDRRFRVCFEEAPPLAFPGAAPSERSGRARSWWRTLVARVFEPWAPFDAFDRCFTELFDYYGSAEAWTLYPEVPETLAALRGRGLTLAVISNFDSRLHGVLRGLGVAPYLENVYVSAEVGYAKPAPEIFAAALEAHGLEPRSAVHVGDSEENDLAGAVQAGLAGVLVDRRTDGSAAPVAGGTRIHSLRELLPLLDRGANSG
ncbi:MAG TPA: HAD-IA family hydrolase [candidate division Zixibacteria bacterium]|nr:HAD-IA family hydrolase [candidate division Zixibacteria bacterium]